MLDVASMDPISGHDIRSIESGSASLAGDLRYDWFRYLITRYEPQRWSAKTPDRCVSSAALFRRTRIDPIPMLKSTGY